MGILRKDYVLDRWVYYATERKKRRMEFKEKYHTNEGKTCFFCAGNEHLTPPEIGRVEYKNSWKIRWFPNKFPAVELKGSPAIKTKNKFYTEGKTYGTHEVIAETGDHKKQLWDLNINDIKEIFDVYALRIKTLLKLKGITYVSVFKNHGQQAGTSLVHSHTQVAAISILPQQVMEEVKAAKKFRKCPYCSIIGLEAKSKRKIIENKNVVVFCPFASRFNLEAWIFPKRHVKSIVNMNDKELYDMAAVLKKILVKLKRLNASYNFYLHYAPAGNDLHFHIKVTPR
ncbi:galactose-1-phosphate uridylyltransferase, partial [archaeon AH-315-M20]|nr:galactose-1-phosphate uridylyltransferase [archaeon AH-315-M20]